MTMAQKPPQANENQNVRRQPALAERKRVTDFFIWLNRLVRWDRLPAVIGVFWLAAYREALRERNLYDTSTIPKRNVQAPPVTDQSKLRHRMSDGSFNDLSDPAMGMAGSRFGRNFPWHTVYPEPEPALLQPSPREISRTLMTRKQFQPASTLNLLAAAWIQFQVHDWFNHGEPQPDDDFIIPLAGDDPWHDPEMRIARTMRDPTRVAGASDGPPTFVNPASQWWDGSAIYGSTEEITRSLRAMEGGKLAVTNGRLPTDPETGIALTGFSDNWWVGLGLLHTLFTLEHNAICNRLQREFPDWSDEQLFQTARLINAALMAKIHTVEWTPAILDNRTLRLAMRINWWGLAGERVSRRFGRLGASDAISGIPGSSYDHHSAPYALTEEFVAVYRMHPLIPDDFEFFSLDHAERVKKLTIAEVSFGQAEAVIDDDLSIEDAFYSFGIAHPGAIQLHNFPRFFQDLELPDGRRIDLAAVDIMRDRERGVPRYNAFRRRLHLPEVESFDDLTPNREWSRELRDLYQGEIDRVDLMVGMYAEELPKGFGFSDTALRIFALMASRRLKSDRFFTDAFTPEVYTGPGMQWIADNTMLSVLLRHYPDLAPALQGVKNTFAPWQRVG